MFIDNEANQAIQIFRTIANDIKRAASPPESDFDFESCIAANTQSNGTVNWDAIRIAHESWQLAQSASAEFAPSVVQFARSMRGRIQQIESLIDSVNV